LKMASTVETKELASLCFLICLASNESNNTIGRYPTFSWKIPTSGSSMLLLFLDEAVYIETSS
jgi:hypothetical protein